MMLFMMAVVILSMILKNYLTLVNGVMNSITICAASVARLTALLTTKNKTPRDAGFLFIQRMNLNRATL